MFYGFFYWLSTRMTYPTVVLRDWSYKPKAPSNSGSILTRCFICFCPSNAPYVGGFVLIEAFEPIAGRGWFLSPRLFANAVGGRLPMPFAIIFAVLVSPKHRSCPKSKAAFYMVTRHGG